VQRDHRSAIQYEAVDPAVATLLRGQTGAERLEIAVRHASLAKAN
jgi:hypothetical protein